MITPHAYDTTVMTVTKTINYDGDINNDDDNIGSYILCERIIHINWYHFLPTCFSPLVDDYLKKKAFFRFCYRTVLVVLLFF